MSIPLDPCFYDNWIDFFDGVAYLSTITYALFLISLLRREVLNVIRRKPKNTIERVSAYRPLMHSMIHMLS